MVKLQKLRLKNYCGYRDSTFEFSDSEGIKNFAIFYGANGSGKSTILNAVKLLGTAYKYEGRDHSILFNKQVFSENYEPTVQQYKEHLAKLMKKVDQTDPNNELYAGIKRTPGFGEEVEMRVEGLFITDQGEKEVIINRSGVVKNDLPAVPNGYSYFIDADHPMEMNKFQLENTDLADVFLELAKIVYGYPVFFDKSVSLKGKEYFTDVCIEKWGTTVHHKSMSDGEKKICALLKSLCEPSYIFNTDIILVDNIEMHIYFKRHAKMFDALMQIFPAYQFIATTHSGTLINHVKDNYDGRFLFDLEVYKKKEFEKFKITENLGMG